MALAPFTLKAYKSQAKMKVLKPEMDKIQEKHKEKDPMKAQQEVMALYKKTGVKPVRRMFTHGAPNAYTFCDVPFFSSQY